jgi:class 3 adenylate cyclase
MAELPTGTVTFLFTDLEGSTRLWQEHPEEMRRALARHDELLREAIEGHSGLPDTSPRRVQNAPTETRAGSPRREPRSALLRSLWNGACTCVAGCKCSALGR